MHFGLLLASSWNRTTDILAHTVSQKKKQHFQPCIANVPRTGDDAVNSRMRLLLPKIMIELHILTRSLRQKCTSNSPLKSRLQCVVYTLVHGNMLKTCRDCKFEIALMTYFYDCIDHCLQIQRICRSIEVRYITKYSLPSDFIEQHISKSSTAQRQNSSAAYWMAFQDWRN